MGGYPRCPAVYSRPPPRDPTRKTQLRLAKARVKGLFMVNTFLVFGFWGWRWFCGVCCTRTGRRMIAVYGLACTTPLHVHVGALGCCALRFQPAPLFSSGWDVPPAWCASAKSEMCVLQHRHAHAPLRCELHTSPRCTSAIHPGWAWAWAHQQAVGTHNG